jgi:hypothetical protein
MKTIPAQILEKGGEKEFAVISYQDYLDITEQLRELREKIEDYEDLLEVRAARMDPDNQAGRPFDEVAREMGFLQSN